MASRRVRVPALYPDRFTRGFRERIMPSDHSAEEELPRLVDGETRVLCFDHEDRRLFEFVYRDAPKSPHAKQKRRPIGPEEQLLRALRDYRIWSELESQTLTVFVGAPKPTKTHDLGNVLFDEGHFRFFKLVVPE